MTASTFLLVLTAAALVMAIWRLFQRPRDSRRYRETPPDLSCFSQSIGEIENSRAAT